MAAAVAAPIPRLAPVTTATRPASHTLLTANPPVETLVRVEAQFQVEPGLGVLTAGGPRDPGHLRYRFDGGPDVIRWHQETRDLVHDHLREAAAPERDDGSPARLGLRGGQPEGLIPAGGIQHHGRPGHGLPQGGPGYCLVNGRPWPASFRVKI